jgi:amino acid transporter
MRCLDFILKRHSRELSVILLGLSHRFLGRGAGNPYPDPAINSQPTAASYAQALYAGLWSFDGFNQANYVAGEMRNPTRDIPRAIHSSMALVAVRLALPPS